MAWIPLRRGKPLAFILAGVLLGASVGIATGAIPAVGTGVFYACYDSGGNLKLIDNAKTTTCPKGHIGPVTWNQTGPAGADGADGADGEDGATGPAGPTGPQGPAGPASGIERVRYDFSIDERGVGEERSQTTFEAGAIVTGLSGTVTLTQIPLGCETAQVVARVHGSNILATWQIDLPGDVTDVAPTSLHAATVNNPAHAAHGSINLSVSCIPHIPLEHPAVTGSIVLEVNHAPRLIT